MQFRNLLCTFLVIAVVAVTCRNSPAVNIVVGDSSFEDTAVSASTDWEIGPGTWAPAWDRGYVHLFHSPPAPLYAEQLGDTLGNISVTGEGGFAAMFQDTTRIEEGTYTFTVGVAHEPNAEPLSAPFLINFEAVGMGGPTVLLAENIYPVGTANSSGLTDIVATLEIPSGHPGIGRMLRPVLLTHGADAGSNPADPRASYMLDNVRLELAPPSGPSRSVRVGQPSFEQPVWYTPFGGLGNTSLFRPEAPLFPGQTGDQLGVLSVGDMEGSWSAFWQDTDVVIQEGTFPLTVGVAHDPLSEPTTAPFLINFESVSDTGAVTLLSENVFPVGTANSGDLSDITATLEIPAGMPHLGETLRVVLVANGADVGSDPGAGRASYLIDDVRLSFESAIGPLLSADFDESGTVDGDDLALWQAAYGMGPGADAGGDSDTDGRDFLIWQRQFGSNASLANTAAVPEPSTIAVAIAGLMLVGSTRFSRWKK